MILRRSFISVLTLLVSLAMVGSVASQATPEASPAATTVSVATSPELGDYLVTPDGKALYIYALDEPGQPSACNDNCAEKWPPYLVSGLPMLPEGVPGELSVIQRADGSSQLAWNGSPLYQFIGDYEPGDTAGHGIGSAWVQCSCHGESLTATPSAAPLIWSLALVPPGNAATPAA